MRTDLKKPELISQGIDNQSRCVLADIGILAFGVVLGLASVWLRNLEVGDLELLRDAGLASLAVVFAATGSILGRTSFLRAITD